MKVLSIETSCDETSIALIKKESVFEILSNIIASQAKIHEKFGGVYPTLAKREHQRNLIPVLTETLKKAGFLEKLQNSRLRAQKSKPKVKILKEILGREKYLFKKLEKFLKKYQKPKIDAMAVTVGPGLEPCLWVGVNFARALGFFWQLPIIPINHLEAHIFANFLNKQRAMKDKQLFPAVCLIISGGHTQLILMRDFGKYKILGETRDDAAGECFDKTARILGLGYPGGPAIEQEAAQFKYREPTSVTLPRPMIHQKNYDFSFSGLKTAVLYDFKKRSSKERKSKQYIREMAAEIQQAIIDVLIEKTIRATKENKAKTIILGGGVAANKELRKQLREKIEKELPNTYYLKPNLSFCTDNAAMIGVTAFYHLNERKNWQEIEAKANLRLG